MYQDVKHIGRWTQFYDALKENCDEFTGGYFLKKLIGFKTCITITHTIKTF